MTKAQDDRYHFIPYRKVDIVQMCLQDQLLEGQEKDFSRLHQMLDSVFHFEFHQTIERLKTAYVPLDPDADTRTVQTTDPAGESDFVDLLEDILRKANYEAITEQDLKHAMSESSLFKIRLNVDFEDFSQVLLFCRGVSTRQETIYRFAGRFAIVHGHKIRNAQKE